MASIKISKYKSLLLCWRAWQRYAKITRKEFKEYVLNPHGNFKSLWDINKYIFDSKIISRYDNNAECWSCYYNHQILYRNCSHCLMLSIWTNGQEYNVKTHGSTPCVDYYESQSPFSIILGISDKYPEKLSFDDKYNLFVKNARIIANGAKRLMLIERHRRGYYRV